MNRWLKIALVIGGVFVTLIVSAAVLLPLFVDPNDYKDQIAAQVEEQTGRDFELRGDITLSVFPWLGVNLGEARLGNAAGFGDKPFAAFNEADVGVRLLPLLSKRIEIGTVNLDGLRLRLARKADGSTNWDDLVAAFSSKEPAPEPPEGDDAFKLPDLEVGAIEFSDAAVTFDDAGEVYRLQDVNLSTGRIVLGEAFPVNLQFGLAADKRGLSADTRLVAELLPDIENKFYRFSDLTVNVHATGDAVPGGEQQFVLTGEGEADLKAGRASISAAKLQGAGVNITANVDGNNILEQARFNGRITVEPLNPRTVMDKLAIQVPATSDPDVLTSASVDTQFKATLDSVVLEQIQIELDDSTLMGDARVAEFANPAIGFQLALDRLDLDRYRPPGDDEDEPETEEQAPAGGAEISLEPLKTLRLDGRLTAGTLTLANLKFEDAELVVTAKDGVLNVEPLGANLYGGNLRIKSRVNAAAEQPTYALNGDVSGLRLSPLLNDLIGQDKIAALANFNLDLTTNGKTVEQLKQALAGNLAFEFRDGLFNAFDLAQILNSARQRLQGGSEQGAGADETPFSRFAASFNVDQGVLSGSDLALVTTYAAVGGKGSYNLVTNKLDYALDAKILEDGGALTKLAGYSIPIKLSGDLFSPSYSVDVKSALKNVGEQKLKEETAKLRQKVEAERAEASEGIDKKVQKKRQELGEKLQKGLGGLFGGSKDEDRDSGGQ